MGAPDRPDLGPCCICEGRIGVRNVVCLPKLCPTPGKGWGCFKCHQPQNGAVAVLCDPCLKTYRACAGLLQWACRGHPGRDGRVPVEELQGGFQHDMLFHQEEDT